MSNSTLSQFLSFITYSKKIKTVKAVAKGTRISKRIKDQNTNITVPKKAAVGMMKGKKKTLSSTKEKVIPSKNIKLPKKSVGSTKKIV